QPQLPERQADRAVYERREEAPAGWPEGQAQFVAPRVGEQTRSHTPGSQETSVRSEVWRPPLPRLAQAAAALQSRHVCARDCEPPDLPHDDGRAQTDRSSRSRATKVPSATVPPRDRLLAALQHSRPFYRPASPSQPPDPLRLSADQ